MTYTRNYIKHIFYNKLYVVARILNTVAQISQIYKNAHRKFFQGSDDILY